jgi:uncharacterized protein (TIGR02646 family)
MIEIDKGTSPPNLAATQLKKSNEMKEAYDKNADDYKDETTKFDFGSAYNTTEVRTLLIKKQHNKCCFSEAKFVGDYSDVEHFRPKGRIDEYPSNISSYPGYYWLAYDWENLFLCKTRPNTSQKRNYFPLYNEAERNRSHNDTNIELPKLIDPGKEDPRKFIRFHLDEPVSVDRKGRGKFNIDFFDLRHSEFEEGRRVKLKTMTGLKKLVDKLLTIGIPIDDPEIVESLDLLRYEMSPQAQFSSMAIDFLSGWPPLM